MPGGGWPAGAGVGPAEPTLKFDALTPRVQPLAVSEARACRAARSLPVTRLADLTPLDRLGFPVFCAVTPLARDLTTHLGKGATAAAARVSALMEAIERACAERDPAGARRVSWRELCAEGARAPDARRFDLPSESRFDPDREITWCPAIDVIGGGEAWLPADLVICPPRDGVILQPDTNGLAAGNTWTEAVVHGLCEVIERDALGRCAFAECYADPGDGAPSARRIDPASLPEGCRREHDRLAARGMVVVLDDLTQDIAVPTLRATIIDPASPSGDGVGLRRYMGAGCHPDAELAATRAINEAAQSRLAVIQGARDSYNHPPPATRAATRRLRAGDLRGGGGDFGMIPTFRSNDLADDLRHLLAALRCAGFGEAFVVDLSDPGFQIPVVRVRLPGLSSFFVDRSRVGLRDLACLV